MNRICHLPTIVTRRSNDVCDGDRVDELRINNWSADIPTSRPRLLNPNLNFIQHCWSRLLTLYRHWELLSAVPLDLLANALFANAPLKPLKTTPIDSAGISIGDRYQTPSNIGRIALHPRLPLLAVYCSNDCGIQLYNVKTSVFMSRVPCRLHQDLEDHGTTESSVVTCLNFSNQNHLAIGLASGTVRVIELDLHSIIESSPSQHEKCREFQIQTVVLLSGCNSKENVEFLGPITNVVFSSDSGTGNGVWLAITTERSGVWVWNHKMKEVVRAISTGGSNEGCLQWVHLSAEPKQPSPPRKAPESPRPTQTSPSPSGKKYLSESTVQRYAGVFGDAEDISKLDEYFSPSVGYSTSLGYSQISTPVPQLISSMNSNSSNLREVDRIPDAEHHNGQSLLIVGTKNGKVRVQKLWHSSMKMQLETFVEFYPHEYTPTFDQLSSKSRPTNAEIMHLAVRPQYSSTSEVTLPILIALDTDTSTLHEFAISLPFVQSTVPRLLQIGRFARTAFQNLVQLPFPLTETDHRWLPSAPQEAGHTSPITYQTSHPIYQSLSNPTVKASITSLRTPLKTNRDLLLATIRPDPSQTFGRPKRSHCVLFSHDPSSPATPLLSIKPLAPTPLTSSHWRGSNHQPLPHHPIGHYTRMLLPPESKKPHTKSRINATHTSFPEIFYEHDIACGQVAWGRSPEGRLLGAYLYHPATLLDDCVGVALFEITC